MNKIIKDIIDRNCTTKEKDKALNSLIDDINMAKKVAGTRKVAKMVEATSQKPKKMRKRNRLKFLFLKKMCQRKK